MKLLHDTHFKLKEAEHFYHRMEKAESEEKVGYFFYNFNAFLSAWRSICCCKEKESEEKKCEKFADFVSNEIDRKLEEQGISKNEIKIMKEKILKKAYNNLTRKEKEVEKKLVKWRNQLVHIKYPLLNYRLPTEHLVVKDEIETAKYSTIIKGRLLEVEWSLKEENTKNGLESSIPSKVELPVHLKVLSESEKEEVLDLCEKGLNMAKKFIENCEKILKSELSR